MTTTRNITRLLIANRGEIARRVMRTARARGIACIAVYSDPDADAPFVREADLAVALRGITSTETYLDSAKVLAAAIATGADAVHPGYGFLSENATFARAVLDAGLIWVGPSPESIAAMAEKVPAKRLVSAAGVPLVPGAELDAEASEDDLRRAGDSVGYPLMVKASSGGGGKGMRVVADAGELCDAVAAARREAASAFGDSTVFLERFLPTARHIEVQVFGDQHGNVGHLFERECSIQRRHQKVVEEAPAAQLDSAVRSGLHAAAVAAARAIDYLGAGTVEFLVDGADYYFLEMNTRLQVEHPVTEEITGIDLVAWQLDVAEGKALEAWPAEPRGHAIEVRLYAEDARNGDLPSTGTLHEFHLEDARVRVDTGVVAGSVVSPYYDPMLAKVVASGDSRQVAAAKLSAGLRAARIHGVTTNRDLLVAICESDAFAREVTTTAFLTDHPEVRTQQPPDTTLRAHALAAAAALWHRAGEQVSDVASGHLAEPAWRNVPRTAGVSIGFLGGAALELCAGDGGVAVHRRARRRRPVGEAGSQHARGVFEWGFATNPDARGTQADAVTWLGDVSVEVADDGASVIVVDADGVRRQIQVALYPEAPGGDDQGVDGALEIWTDDPRDHAVWRTDARFPDSDAAAGAGGPSAPVPGTIVAVLVEPGAEVRVGDTVVVLEAMKMEHRITADADGLVDAVLVAVGDSVDAHQVVVRLNAREEAE